MYQKVEKYKINFEFCQNDFQMALKTFFVVNENVFRAPKSTFDDSKTFVGPKNVFVFLFQRGGYFPDASLWNDRSRACTRGHLGSVIGRGHEGIQGQSGVGIKEGIEDKAKE